MDLKILADDLELELDEFYELAELFVSTADSDLAQLKAALARNTVDDAVNAAHSLKGAAGNLGFRELSGLAENIEEALLENRLEGISDTLAALEKSLGQVGGALRMGGE
jgi:HPt (histidine-containing phosphotransfer) domain-containing protein